MMNRSMSCKLDPSRRELVGGLTILTVLACVLISRDGRPRETWADRSDVHPTASPAVLVEQVPAKPDKPGLASGDRHSLQLANEQSLTSMQP